MKLIGSRDSNRRETQSGSREAQLAERSVEPKRGRRNTNRQRGRLRAMSVLGNAKSNRHRKTQTVESDDTSRKSLHLTRGDLPAERVGGVSRGRSSEEAARKSGRAKGQRTTKGVILKTPLCGREVPRNAPERQLRQLPWAARGDDAVEPRWQTEWGTSPTNGERREQKMPNEVPSVGRREGGEKLTLAGFNRRMRKTACPVVWEPRRAQSRRGDPIP